MTPSVFPSHHRPGGGFHNPWVENAVPAFGSLLKWMLVHRTTRPRPKDPDPSVFKTVRHFARAVGQTAGLPADRYRQLAHGGTLVLD